MEVLLVLVVLAAVVWIVSAPLRPGRSAQVEQAESSEQAELEALKEAKYREIRDAEMDFRTGKLSDPDYKALDRALRAEANRDAERGAGQMAMSPPRKTTMAPIQIQVTSGETSMRNVAGGGSFA